MCERVCVCGSTCVHMYVRGCAGMKGHMYVRVYVRV